MKTIVVATDFSYNANNALDYAASLAAYTGAKIILFNAFQLPLHASNTILSSQGVDELLKTSGERLENVAIGISNRYKISIESITRYEFVGDALEIVVKEFEADVVVMGMHANDWSDRFLGNTTTTVIRSASYPVLVVPQNATFNPITKILYAFDTNCLYVRNQLSLLKDFAKSFKAEVQVYHVERARKQPVGLMPKASALVEVALDEVDHCYKDTEDKDVLEGIERGIEEFDANMLVMVPHKLSFWEGLLNQSTTRNMALRTHIPLLVLPNQ